MQQYAMDCMLHVVIAVYSVLYLSVSGHHSSAFNCAGCGVSIYAIACCVCGWCQLTS